MFCFKCSSIENYKMNDIINKFLLAGDTFMPEMYLKQLQLTYSACGPFTKSKERIQKFKKTGDTKYVHRNELNKASFQHDMAYGDFKDLAKRQYEEDGTQNYLVFQPMYRYFKRTAGVGSGNYIYFWKSKGLSDERINSITASNYSINPELNHYGIKTIAKFSGSCLKQDKAADNGTVVNIYIVYEISKKL